uniref:cytochrome P450 2J3-like n=1 Tax=Styela clava TaxID=7725 RepID=UPI001939ADAC|nr:cytochrome P450 2J3-like [Styela clava]
MSTKRAVLDNKLAVSAFSKQGRLTSARPMNRIMLDIAANGITMTNGKIWKTSRTLAVRILNNFNKRIIEEHISEEANYLCESIQEKLGADLDVRGFHTKAIANVIFRITFGSRFPYDDKRFNILLQPVLNLTDDNFGTVLGILIIAPFMRHFPFLKQSYGKFISHIKVLQGAVENIIAEHRGDYDEENCKDFIDYSLAEVNKGAVPDFTNVELVATVIDLVAAATETTTSVIRWCILAILHYPYCQEKIAKELHDVVGTEEK